ncbi:MAG TPA: LamG domain-containing protein [Chthonomonadaceae bacterium]|nr:LamG domain-containing protein [Chthonomonadaceae bacterium]
MNKRLWSRLEFLMFGGACCLLRQQTDAQKESPISPYAAAVLRKRPDAYFRLGEQDGPTAHDASGHNGTGIYRGHVAYGERGAIGNDSNTAVKLNGRDAYVEVPDNAHFSQRSSGKGLTVEVWMRPDSLEFSGETDEHYVHWLGKGDSGRLEWGFRFYSRHASRPNRISAYLWNPNGELGSGAYVQEEIQPGQWIHVVACYDPGDKDDPAAGVSIFKDGVLKGNPRTQIGALYRTYGIRSLHGSAPLRLGTRDLRSFFQGEIDEFAIYPRVLSADEIAENYRLGHR